jgi:DNA-binding CsgD family transcriptional regulator
MHPVSNARLIELIESLRFLYEPCDLVELPLHLLAAARSCVQTDGNAYNEVNPAHSRAIGVLDNPDWKMEDLVEPLETHMHEHPVINHCHSTRDGSARKISDFMSKADFHDTGLYLELYCPLNIQYQMAITIPTPGNEIVAVVLNRSGVDFVEEDRAVLNLLRPHIGQAYHNAIALKKLKDEQTRLNGTLEALQQCVVIIDPKFRIKFASPRAHGVLTQFFGPRTKSSKLPAQLENWLARHIGRNWRKGTLPPVREPLRVFADDRWLLVRWLGKAIHGELTLVLQEQASAGSAAEKLRPLGLTDREAEVLYWVVQGKTNPEIAIICGGSPRTVQKHLEHIFGKLGVETRTAAALRASELL